MSHEVERAMAGRTELKPWRRFHHCIQIAAFILMSGCRDAPTPPVIRNSNTSVTATSGEPIVAVSRAPRSQNYVGSAVCADCHSEINKSYFQTSMGNSAAAIDMATEIENYHATPVIASRIFRMHASKTDDGVYHHEQLLAADGEVMCQQDVPIAWELGSGKRGRSYLVTRDDQLMLSPLTWYSTPKLWDVSPGYEKRNLHFERRIVTACVQCHVGRIAPHSSPAEDRFASPAILETGISCERCHGPAADHVDFHKHSGDEVLRSRLAEDRVINPAKLSPHLRESVCNECHQLGAERVLRFGMQEQDFRPGDSLSSVWVIFSKGSEGVSADQTTDAVSQVRQMESSQCYQKSEGRFGCISCHDPHSQPMPENQIEHYRNVCLKCHSESQPECSVPLDLRIQTSPSDSCIECHMRTLAASDVQHTSQTDHRVLKKPQQLVPSVSDDVLQLAHGMDDLPEWEIQRARGLLMARFAIEFEDPALAVMASDQLQPLADRGLNDTHVQAALGDTYLMQNRLEIAEQCWKKSLAIHPGNEQALRSLAMAVHDAGRDQEAEQLLATLLKNNQWDRSILGRHIHVLGRLERSEEAMKEAEEAVARFPFDGMIRQWLANACDACGRHEDAESHRVIAKRLLPKGI